MISSRHLACKVMHSEVINEKKGHVHSLFNPCGRAKSRQERQAGTAFYEASCGGLRGICLWHTRGRQAAPARPPPARPLASPRIIQPALQPESAATLCGQPDGPRRRRSELYAVGRSRSADKGLVQIFSDEPFA